MPLLVLNENTIRELQFRRAYAEPRSRLWCRILLLSAQLDSAQQVADQAGTNLSAVRSAIRRFDHLGLAGLTDLRQANGRHRVKVTRAYVATVRRLLTDSPRAHGIASPRWTRFSIARVAARHTGIPISPSTAARLIRRLAVTPCSPQPSC